METEFKIKNMEQQDLKEELKQKLEVLITTEGLCKGIWYDDINIILDIVKNDLIIARHSDIIGSIQQ